MAEPKEGYNSGIYRVVSSGAIDSDGNYVVGGAALVTDVGAATVTSISVEALSSGQGKSIAVTAGALYEVDSDVDLRYKTSAAATEYGVIGMNDDASVKTTGASLASTATTFDFGTDNFTIEMRLKDAEAASQRILSIGGSGAGEPFMSLRAFNQSNGAYTAQFEDNDGAEIIGNGAGGEATVTPPSWPHSAGDLIHCHWVFTRGTAGASPCNVKLYVNGSLIDDTDNAANEQNPLVALDCSDATTATNIVSFGTARNAVTTEFVGDLYLVRTYKQALTQAQITARVNAAQSRINDSANNNLSFELMFDSSGTWSDADQPESSDLSAIDAALAQITFDNSTSNISDLVGGGASAASSQDSRRIYSNQKTFIQIPTGQTYLNLLAAVGSSGDVTLSKV